MQRAFEKLGAVPGVLGAFATEAGRLRASSLPAFFGPEMLDGVGEPLIKALHSAERLSVDIRELKLHFGDTRVVVSPLSAERLLVIVCQQATDLILLSETLDGLEPTDIALPDLVSDTDSPEMLLEALDPAADLRTSEGTLGTGGAAQPAEATATTGGNAAETPGGVTPAVSGPPATGPRGAAEDSADFVPIVSSGDDAGKAMLEAHLAPLNDAATPQPHDTSLPAETASTPARENTASPALEPTEHASAGLQMPQTEAPAAREVAFEAAAAPPLAAGAELGGTQLPLERDPGESSTGGSSAGAVAPSAAHAGSTAPAGREQPDSRPSPPVSRGASTAARHMVRTPLSKEARAQLQLELARFVGPVASLLVAEALRSGSALPDVLEHLAEEIESEDDRQAFLANTSALIK